MNERATTYESGFLLTLVALVLLLLIIPAASAAAHRLKPAWRAWVWPLVFGSLAATSLCSALAALLDVRDTGEPLWKAVHLLAGLAFTFLALNTLYRAFNDWLAPRLAPLVWAVYLVFVIGVLATDLFVPVLIYDAACSVLVFIFYSSLYARDRDRAADAVPIMIGTGLVLLADLIASFEFTVSLGIFGFSQLLPFNLLQIAGLVFFYRGASASYNVKYNMQRTRERALSSRQSG